MPLVITTATGPGRVAFSRDATGELVLMPLHPGMELDVREHAFVLASRAIDYSYVRIKGLRNILFGGQGMFMDRFVTTNTPGLLVLHGYGNVFERRLTAGESILIEPGAFLYKDAAVTMEVEIQRLSAGFFGGMGMSLARMTGPGRPWHPVDVPSPSNRLRPAHDGRAPPVQLSVVPRLHHHRAGGADLPGLRSRGGRPPHDGRCRLVPVAADPRHGAAPVWGVALPDRWDLRPRRGLQPRSGRPSLFQPSCPALEGAADDNAAPATEGLVAAPARRAAAGHVAGQRPRPHRVLERRAGRADRRTAAA